MAGHLLDVTRIAISHPLIVLGECVMICTIRLLPRNHPYRQVREGLYERIKPTRRQALSQCLRRDVAARPIASGGCPCRKLRSLHARWRRR